MNQTQIKYVIGYVEKNIASFHQNRLQSLQKLKLTKLLKRKNPYLFKAKNIQTAQDLIKAILDAHLSSNEETIFGEFLEDLAIFVCEKVHGGRKSPAEGIDLGFEYKKALYLVSIKSGPNWGNSQQLKRMEDNFRKAKRILGSKKNIICVNGCCYGRNDQYNKGDYLKLCGQRFWELISEDENFYTDIIEPLGHKAKEKNREFDNSYAKILNQFTKEFIDKFCLSDYSIDWEKLVIFNSSKQKLLCSRKK